MVITDRIAGLTASVAMKAPVAAASTANLTLSGEQTVDGQALTSGDRILVKDQSTTSENGIYKVATTAWSRAADWDGARDVRKGTLVFVTDGTTNGDTFWKVTTANPITPGTTSVSLSQFNTGLGAASAFVQTLLDDADAAAFMTTLGFSAHFQDMVDDANAAASRATIGAGTSSVAASQTDGFGGLIEAPAEQDYRIVIQAPFAFTINSTTTRCLSGTCTATFKINTTALGGTANSVSSSEQEQTHSSSNSVSAGDDVVITISSNSSCVDMSFMVKITRTLA